MSFTGRPTPPPKGPPRSMPDSILITGGAGFVGSTLALSIRESHLVANVTVFFNLRLTGTELNLPRRHSRGLPAARSALLVRHDKACGRTYACGIWRRLWITIRHRPLRVVDRPIADGEAGPRRHCPLGGGALFRPRPEIHRVQWLGKT